MVIRKSTPKHSAFTFKRGRSYYSKKFCNELSQTYGFKSPDDLKKELDRIGFLYELDSKTNKSRSLQGQKELLKQVKQTTKELLKLLKEHLGHEERLLLLRNLNYSTVIEIEDELRQIHDSSESSQKIIVALMDSTTCAIPKIKSKPLVKYKTHSIAPKNNLIMVLYAFYKKTPRDKVVKCIKYDARVPRTQNNFIKKCLSELGINKSENAIRNTISRENKKSHIRR